MHINREYGTMKHAIELLEREIEYLQELDGNHEKLIAEYVRAIRMLAQNTTIKRHALGIVNAIRQGE